MGGGTAASSPFLTLFCVCLKPENHQTEFIWDSNFAAFVMWGPTPESAHKPVLAPGPSVEKRGLRCSEAGREGVR